MLRNRSVRTLAILLFLFAQPAVTARADNPPAPQPTGDTPQSLVEFLGKGRAGMSSTFLARLLVGDSLVDASGVSRLRVGELN